MLRRSEKVEARPLRLEDSERHQGSDHVRIYFPNDFNVLAMIIVADLIGLLILILTVTAG
jgi:hypothetical protein